MTDIRHWLAPAFDDRNRGPRACLAIVALLGVMTWFAFDGPLHEITFAQCLADPVRWNGKDLVLSVQRVSAVGDGYFTVRAGRVLGRVRPNDGRMPADIHPGATISASGVFRTNDDVEPRGELEAGWVYVHTTRRWKNFASLVGMIGALGAGLLVFRWSAAENGLTERFEDA